MAHRCSDHYRFPVDLSPCLKAHYPELTQDQAERIRLIFNNRILTGNDIREFSRLLKVPNLVMCANPIESSTDTSTK